MPRKVAQERNGSCFTRCINRYGRRFWNLVDGGVHDDPQYQERYSRDRRDLGQACGFHINTDRFGLSIEGYFLGRTRDDAIHGEHVLRINLYRFLQGREDTRMPFRIDQKLLAVRSLDGVWNEECTR